MTVNGLNNKNKQLALTISGLGWYVIDGISDNNSVPDDEGAATCKGVDCFSLSLETVTSASGSSQKLAKLAVTSCDLKHTRASENMAHSYKHFRHSE